MFADSLLDNHWDNRSHRGWTTTLASFALEALCVGIALLLPLLYTEGLPQLQLMGTIAFGSAIPIDSNRAPARRWGDDVLGLHLELRSAVWCPEAETRPSLKVSVFGRRAV